MSKHFHSGEKPKAAVTAITGRIVKQGCSLGEENCIYEKPVQQEAKSECADCPYGRVHPCIGWCTKKLLNELHNH